MESLQKAFLSQDLLKIWGEEEKEFVQELESDLQSPTEEDESKSLQELVLLSEYLEQDLILARIPASNPYELACYMPMGDFNECPKPALQAAIFKRWSEILGGGFYPVVVSSDVWQCMLLPFKDSLNEETLNKLVKEHLIFCPDILQSYENLKEYKSMLKYSSVWYFWWD